METIQLALANTSYATALREMLLRDGTWEVCCVELPDSRRPGVMVLDAPALDRLPPPLPDPERIVLIAPNDPHHLARAWEAGIVSVVFDNDPLSTAMLAIMAARLRVAKLVRRGPPPGPALLNPAAGHRARRQPNGAPSGKKRKEELS